MKKPSCDDLDSAREQSYDPLKHLFLNEMVETTTKLFTDRFALIVMVPAMQTVVALCIDGSLRHVKSSLCLCPVHIGIRTRYAESFSQTLSKRLPAMDRIELFV